MLCGFEPGVGPRPRVKRGMLLYTARDVDCRFHEQSAARGIEVISVGDGTTRGYRRALRR